jgi:hypothetical protein
LAGGGGKSGFGGLDVETIGGEDGVLVEVAEVLLWGGAKNEDVVKVNKNERKGVKKGIHEVLKGLGGVAEAKRHEKELKKGKRGDDGGFGYVGGVHWDLVVTFLEVNFGKNGGVVEAG